MSWRMRLTRMFLWSASSHGVSKRSWQRGRLDQLFNYLLMACSIRRVAPKSGPRLVFRLDTV